MASFAVEADLESFGYAIEAGEHQDSSLEYIVTSLNEWNPPDDPRRGNRRSSERTSDEGREGYSYRLLRWPTFVRCPLVQIC
jgi:hypothetical protein